MPTETSPARVVLNRKHPFLVKRERQLKLNRLAVDGGAEYVHARLSRAPNESDLSWLGRYLVRGGVEGGPAVASVDFGVTGRRDRTAYVNDAGRVCGKIQQYLFKEPVKRDGADDDFLANMGGRDYDQVRFWMDVSEALTCQQWVWIQASRDGVAASLGERTEADRVRWTAYPSVSVPDFFIDERGDLKWIIVESVEQVRDNPFVEDRFRTVRSLWMKDPQTGAVSLWRFSDKTPDGLTAEWQDGPVALDGLDELPFALVGRPSPSPWWFDDAENIQSVLLNLDSIHVDNLGRSVYPQLVISESTLNSLEAKLVQDVGADRGQLITRIVREIVRGADTPIVESAEESGTTRYIAPSAADLKAIPDEIERKRALLFDITGLSLFNKETRQTQTAESKQFDQLDTESTLKNRALLMQEAEKRLVAISRALDPNFKEYEPVWPSSFDVVDAASDMQVVTMVAQLPDAVPAMRKMALKAAVRVISTISGHDKELEEQAAKEIDELEFKDDAEAFPAFGEPGAEEGEEGGEPGGNKPGQSAPGNAPGSGAPA